MEPVTLALLLGGALLLGSKKSGSKSSSKASYDQKMTRQQRIAMMAEIRKMSAYASSRFGMMPYLADYLTVVGYIESRFNPTSVNPEIRTNKNAARGLFGMRPDTAFKESDGLEGLRSRPNLLLNPIWAFCTAVNHIAQADQRSLQKAGREADWFAVRRWWGYPHLVSDYDLSEERSRSSMNKFINGIEGVNQEYGANINEDFAWMPVSRGGYPGIKPLLSAFGAKL
jgi:hypothetical protein